MNIIIKSMEPKYFNITAYEDSVARLVMKGLFVRYEIPRGNDGIINGELTIIDGDISKKTIEQIKALIEYDVRDAARS